jgi:hypothetical protein
MLLQNHVTRLEFAITLACAATEYGAYSSELIFDTNSTSKAAQLELRASGAPHFLQGPKHDSFQPSRQGNLVTVS